MNHHTPPHLFAKAAGLMLSAALLLAAGNTSAIASQIVYVPANPSFGGNAFNGPYMMSIAQQASSRNAPNPLAGFDLSALSDTIKSMDTKLDDLCKGTCAVAGTETP